MPVFHGYDTASALEFVRSFQDTRDALARHAPADAAGALRRLRDTLEDHRTAEGVMFDSRAWIITARARGPR